MAVTSVGVLVWLGPWLLEPLGLLQRGRVQFGPGLQSLAYQDLIPGLKPGWVWAQLGQI